MDKDIDRIQKNPETDIVIRVDDYMGKKGVTIREFVKSERYTGFTKAGTRIPADKFHLFKKAINSIDEKDLEGSSQDTQEHASHDQHSHSSAQKSEPKKTTKAKQVDLEETEF